MARRAAASALQERVGSADTAKLQHCPSGKWRLQNSLETYHMYIKYLLSPCCLAATNSYKFPPHAFEDIRPNDAALEIYRANENAAPHYPTR